MTADSQIGHRRQDYLLHHKWLTWDVGSGRGEELFLNGDLLISAVTLQHAHRTTRKMMFSGRKEQQHARS
jgi:hypothetical protein